MVYGKKTHIVQCLEQSATGQMAVVKSVIDKTVRVHSKFDVEITGHTDMFIVLWVNHFPSFFIIGDLLFEHTKHVPMSRE